MKEPIFVCPECLEQLHINLAGGCSYCGYCPDESELTPMTYEEYKQFKKDRRWNDALDDFIRAVNDPDDNRPIWD